MKKVLILTFAVLLIGAMTASAQTSQSTQNRQQTMTQARNATNVGPNFVDANGDGICDNFQAGTRAGRMGAGPKGAGRRGGWGPGDGTGNQGVGPKDGTGFGPGPGSGLCDGTGPKGFGRGRGPRK